MTVQITPVILCGGSGTRLWPLSRQSYPKQFSALLGSQSLFQRSVERLSGRQFHPALIVTASDFRFIVTEQMAAIKRQAGAILIEPESRNTAPAILAAALYLEGVRPGALMLVAPSDHVIPDAAAFRAAVAEGVPAATSGQIVTFGITPTQPETGYGYLELAEPAKGPQPLVRFVEKPDAKTALAMLASGRFLWNAGIFLFTTTAILSAYEVHAAAMLRDVQRAVLAAEPDLDFLRLGAEAFAAAERTSIDYAVMEKAANLTVVPYHGAWSDLGSWAAVHGESPQDGNGVALSGAATAIDCRNSVIRSEEAGMEVVGIGVSDLIVVAMRDAVLVAGMDRAQEVRQAVTALQAKGAAQADQFPRVHRPWGHFETLLLAQRFHVKMIVVRPGQKLSLQSHVHRSEHWIVVAGTARATIGEAVTLLTENQSIYVPMGTVHRLENPGKVDLQLVEVQTGAYLLEDDITRYDDIYARAT